MSAKGGEAYFVLAMERQLWLALRSFPRRLVQARFPPRPCEKAMFKSLWGSGPEARLGLLAGSVKANKYRRFSASNPAERGDNSSAKTAQL
jgi:hypothetical protein